MADVIVSPIPTNGGTLSMTAINSHVVHLSGNRFFAMFSQATPNLLFALTFDLSSVTSLNPTATAVKQRAMSAIAPTRLRLWKLSTTAVLALVGTDLKVFKIQADGDVVESTAILSAFHSTNVWGTDAAGTLGIGTLLYGTYIKDNTVWFTQRTSTTSAVTLFRIDYNPTGETLTKTNMQTIAASTVANNVWCPRIERINGTTNYLVFGVGGSTLYGTGNVTSFYVFSQAGASLMSVTSGIPTGIRHIVYLASNRILGLMDNRIYYSYNGSSWSAGVAYCSGTALSLNFPIVRVAALDAQHYLLFACNFAVSSAVYTRVSRYISDLYGQTSATTEASGGLTQTLSSLYFDQETVYTITHNTTYALFGRSATTFQIRLIHHV